MVRANKNVMVALERARSELAERSSASGKLMERAWRVMPGGMTKSHYYHLPHPLFFTRRKGTDLWDADGNRYIDLEYNGTSMIHGHAFEPVQEAIRTAIERGSSWPTGSSRQVEFAESIIGRSPSFEQVRICNSGTEASILAAKLARRATGRNLLLKAWLGHHGAYDDLEAGTHGMGELPGRTLLAPFGDAGAFEEILHTQGEEIAAVVLEPVMILGLVAPPAGFLERVRKACTDAGTVLVFDECVMFRLSTGGAQLRFGVWPDLTMLSKFIGGGIPTGAVAGRRDLLAPLDRSSASWMAHDGTFNGNELAAVGGVATLSNLDQEAIDEMGRHAQRLEIVLRAAADQVGIPFSVNREGSLLALYFTPRPTTFEELRPGSNGSPNEAPDADLILLFHLLCLKRGLFIAPSREIVLSTAVTDAILDEVAERLSDVMDELGAAAV
jgi:glutamate-1-semialdehyde 2,1-aminomutase